MARQKPAAVIGPIHDNQQADQVLAELAEINRAISGHQDAMNDGIDQMKKACEARCEPFVKHKRALETSLQAYAEYHREELFASKKTVDLLFGQFGYRKSTSLKPGPKNTWAKVLEKLKRLAKRDAIRVRESVDKDELSTWSDDRLEAVGVARESKDQFWYETKEQDLSAA